MNDMKYVKFRKNDLKKSCSADIVEDSRSQLHDIVEEFCDKCSSLEDIISVGKKIDKHLRAVAIARGAIKEKSSFGVDL
ncbi:MAG: hypothetical protein LBG88_02800 [Christensenellaceae bacterium]|jgi:citrate lyase synthetase|nr:hypothetical protein [Christensenellaceae bacterium]